MANTRRMKRGGNSNSYAFNYTLFEQMKPTFLGLVPINETYLNEKPLLADLERKLREFVADKRSVKILINNDEIYNDDIYDFAQIITAGMYKELLDSDETWTNYMKELIRDGIKEFIEALPEANRKSVKNAGNAYNLMKEKVPANIAAQISAYHTGVAPVNNPSYMR